MNVDMPFPEEIARTLQSQGISFVQSLISPRFARRQSAFTRRLADSQQEAIAEAIDWMSTGRLRFEAVTCVCGGRRFRVLSLQDRFSLPAPVSACRDCGLLQTNPRLDAGSNVEFYQRFYRRIYMGWEPSQLFQNQRSRGRNVLAWLESRGFQPGADKTVYEIGTGAGGILSVFAERGCKTAGCDYDPRFLAYGCQHGLDLRQGDAGQLLASGPADLVILCHVFEHMTDPLAELTRIRGLLSSRGQLWIQVPGIDYELLRFHVQGHRQFDFLDYAQNAHAYHFNGPDLLWMARRAGFQTDAWDDQVTALMRPVPLTEPASLDERIPWCPTIDGDPSLHQLARLQRMERRRRNLGWLEQPCRQAVSGLRTAAGSALRGLGLAEIVKRAVRGDGGKSPSPSPQGKAA
jgi:SAM-dependent methyltransferase